MEADDEAEAISPTLVIELAPPIAAGGRQYDTLDLREPRLSEVRTSEELIGAVATPHSVTEAELKLVTLVSGLPPEAVDSLPASVHDRAVLFLSGFEERGRRLGEQIPSLTLEFDPPVETQRGSYHEMMLREPKISERRRAEQHLSRALTASALRAAEISMVVDVSGWPMAAVLKMPVGRFGEAAAYVGRFLAHGRATGASSRLS